MNGIYFPGELFWANCASCHGENAKGAAAGEMPAFADILQHEPIWDIINFIKTQ